MIELFPRPRLLTVAGAGAALSAPIAEIPDAGLPDQGFTIDTSGPEIVLRYADDAALRYGRETLKQLRAQGDGAWPAVRIQDWPDFPVRGFLLDISRGRVPTMESFSHLLGVLRLARFNQLQLYTEHTFAYTGHQDVWRDASPMTAAEIRTLDALCGNAGIELVPNQCTHAHLDAWLSHDAYRYLAECPDGCSIAGTSLPAGTLKADEESAAFVHSLLAELLPNFTSRQIHINCDEPFELGRGAGAAQVAELGTGEVYVQHLRRLMEPLLAQGYCVQFWADFISHHPGLARSLPPGCTAVAWTYESPRPESERIQIPPDFQRLVDELDLNIAFDGFAEALRDLPDSGLPFLVAPGTSTWNSLVGRIDNAIGNITDAVRTGLASGAEGLLLSEWGDNGHLQAFCTSYPPIVYGGAAGWCLAVNADLDLPAVLDRYVFHDHARVLGGVLDTVGRVWDRTGQRSFNSSPLQAALIPEQRHLITHEPDTDLVEAVIATLERALADLTRARPDSPDGSLAVRELAAAIGLARHGAWRLGRTAGLVTPCDAEMRADLATWIAKYRECWLARNRPGGMERGFGPLTSTLNSYAQ
ncbi:glycoside hydrolase family 20 zincin-like fold domain-containing protein [Nonomuraea glycinis]|uniref:glycoside hydrolase family 20 zincin-like fold domain-containing protein n=1 Tax=Nonomuraea glycinis TaxID=2047744 RepID=UPI0033BD0793